MIYVHVERTVRRRPEIVWDVLSDIPALTSWVEGLVEVDVEEEAARGVGLAVRVVRKDAARRIAATCEVTAWRAPRLLAFETRARGYLSFDRVTLEPLETGTQLDVYAEIVFGSRLASLFARPRGLFGAAPDPVADALEASYERTIDALVKRVETASAVPYR